MDWYWCVWLVLDVVLAKLLTAMGLCRRAVGELVSNRGDGRQLEDVA